MKYIDQPSLLDFACQLTSGASWVSVDTEADSLHHYKEKLCLLQISAGDEDLVIDPLLVPDLGEFFKILKNKKLILHGSDFDLRMLKKFCDFRPLEIFDTLIAAQLLGYEKQGLSDLVFKHFNVTLSKSAQKADWSLRPLEQKLLTYAANDTHYLYPLYEIMSKELKDLGRLSWHSQMCEKIVASVLSEKEDAVALRPNWQIKGSKELSGRALAILKTLWQWREKEAQRKDRPPFKVLNSEILIELAKWAVQFPDQDVTALPNAPRNVKGEHREALNAAIRSAKDQSAEKYIHKKFGAR